MSIDQSPLGQIAQSIVEKRYFRKDKDGNPTEDWRGLVNRVVNHVCASEPQNYKDKIFDLIYSTKFLPNSPCLVNAGTPVGGLLACFVTKSPEDSWVGMMENLANFGHIARRGGGCGVDFSNIRPEGDMVFGSTHARACGPIRHMIVVSEAMNSITQAGFRGMANMGVLRVDHPDIEKFIVCKQRQFALKYLLKEDLFNHYDGLRADDGSLLTHEHANILLDKFISNFNISVLVTDEFMRAVENDTDFDLTFKGKVYKTIRAKELFQKIVTNAWKNGDPGLLFYNAINDGPYKWSGQELTATNPCVSGSTKVLTTKGPMFIKDMIGRKHMVLSYDDRINHFVWLNTTENGAFKTKSNAETITIVTEHSQITCTPDHKIFTTDGYKEGKDIREGEFIWSNPIGLETPYGLDNTSREERSRNGIEIPKLASEPRRTRETTEGLVSRWIRVEENRANDINFWLDIRSFEEIFYQKEYASQGANSYYAENQGNEIIECQGREESFLSMDAKSTACAKNQKIQLRLVSIIDSREGVSAEFIRVDNGDVFRLQVNTMETGSARFHTAEWRNIQARLLHLLEEWETKENNRGEERIHFSASGLQGGDVKESVSSQDRAGKRYIALCSSTFEIDSKGSARMEKVLRVTKNEDLEDVYDLTIDDKHVHNFIANGLVVHNCGEQMLPQFGSCNLGSIDVSKFYDAKNDDVDWDSLKTAIEVSFQFLDDVIDINVFPTPDFEAWAKDNRPVGLGIMGWADLLLKLKIRYGSEDSIEMADKLGKFFHDVSHKKSVQLGKEKGAPKCCQYKELEFRRNATTLSIAPTGSISLIAGCASSIEPIFAPVTYRYDNTGQYTMPHPDSSKPYFRCAVDKESKGKREVTWQEHVDMQAIFQKHIDSGISKTINMPNDSTEEDIASAYLRSWKNKCKGITIYRDGCKTTQVLNTDRKPFSQNNTQYRPQAVNCDIHRTIANGKDWHIIVGKVDDAPYEIFAVNGRVELPSKGVVVKKKKRHYSLLSEDNEVLIDNLNDEEELINDKLGLETRRFSLELRHGIHPKFIVQQIDKSNESLVSFSKAVSRIIKKHYLSDEDCVAIASDVSCPSCASNNVVTEMISESGCWRCPACNYSKCG